MEARASNRSKLSGLPLSETRVIPTEASAIEAVLPAVAFFVASAVSGAAAMS